VVLLLRNKAGTSCLQALDIVSETPELIWTLEMQGELRYAILDLLGPINNSMNDQSEGILYLAYPSSYFYYLSLII
jgi:hypothetical protein